MHTVVATLGILLVEELDGHGYEDRNGWGGYHQQVRHPQ